MNKLKKLLLLGTPFVCLSVPVLAVSCQKKPVYNSVKATGEYIPFNEYSRVGNLFDRKFSKTIFDRIQDKDITVETNYWEQFSYIDCEVISWADGDTVTVRSITPSFTYFGTPARGKGSIIKVRISSIDTLEEHLPNTEVDPNEKAFAEIDHAFAESICPKGSIVRLITNNWADNSHDRSVGEIFFGENFEKCFSVEMLANGYTLARLEKTVFNSFKANHNLDIKPSISDLLFPYLAYGINYAIDNKKGFYDQTKEKHFKSPQEFSNMYKAHGDMLSHSLTILDPAFDKEGKITPENNIYSILTKD
ncbi:thermonuclease family protein [[Mycoplasma] anseris]|uniref:TNase-like domain-containing protein n=1 Tax=[Mycoplasma] anseris TaxID=92400 RepID=A0A2Z4ND37_9BACT|nr:thermonuclease family protein [[Mycoplasma] anseris]AWX69470.1 hypothetical protein DP065_01745 [[Mycoplasma] anseris]